MSVNTNKCPRCGSTYFGSGHYCSIDNTLPRMPLTDASKLTHRQWKEGEEAVWVADKVCALGDYGQDAARVLRRQVAELADLRSQVAELQQQRQQDAIDGQCALDDANNRIVELQRQLDDLIPVRHMLTLCGENECRDIDNYAGKVRAILDAMITYRQKLDEAAKQSSGIMCSCIECVGNLPDGPKPDGWLYESSVGVDVTRHRISDGFKGICPPDMQEYPLYRHLPNLPALIEQAVKEEREACAKMCEEPLNINGTSFISHRLADAIRARKP